MAPGAATAATRSSFPASPVSNDPQDFIDRGWVSTCCQGKLAGGCCLECGEQDDGEREDGEPENESEDGTKPVETR